MLHLTLFDFAMFVVPQIPGCKKSVTNYASPSQWVGNYKSFAEAMLKGAPYNSQVSGFIDSMNYCPEDYKAVQLIRIGEDDCSQAHWNSALKIVCRNASARANGEFRAPSDHEVQLGLRAQSLCHSLDRLSDLLSGLSSSNDSAADSTSDSDDAVPPKLTRQRAVNPELQHIHRLTLEAELNVARDTNYYKVM